MTWIYTYLLRTRFYDARPPTETCPMCPQTFPKDTDSAILTAHVHTHFPSLPPTASAPPAAAALEPEAVILAEDKECPVCHKRFPGDSDKFGQFESHVNGHFEQA